MGGADNEGDHGNRHLLGREVWALALEEKLPETSLGSLGLTKSEVWFKVRVQGPLVLKGLRTEESKRHCEQEEIRKIGCFFRKVWMV